MANSKIDIGEEFKKSGMTLISDPASDLLLKKASIMKHTTPPKDRLSRPCGGIDGFDDFVERFEEGT